MLPHRQTLCMGTSVHTYMYYTLLYVHMNVTHAHILLTLMNIGSQRTPNVPVTTLFSFLHSKYMEVPSEEGHACRFTVAVATSETGAPFLPLFSSLSRCFHPQGGSGGVGVGQSPGGAQVPRRQKAFPPTPSSLLTQAPLEAQSFTQRISLEGGKGWGWGARAQRKGTYPRLSD